MMVTALALGALPAGTAVLVIDIHNVPPGVFAGEDTRTGTFHPRSSAGV